VAIDLSRRQLLGASGAAIASAAISAPLAPTWESLAASYRVPDWFRDAKFGIWAHWGPQCEPEFGDWYARLMYMQHRQSWQQSETPYENHLRRYGHPSRTASSTSSASGKLKHGSPKNCFAAT